MDLQVTPTCIKHGLQQGVGLPVTPQLPARRTVQGKPRRASNSQLLGDPSVYWAFSEVGSFQRHGDLGFGGLCSAVEGESSYDDKGILVTTGS